VYDDSFGVYFDDAIFTDALANDWMTKDGNRTDRQVLSLFCPRGVDGRPELLSKPADYWLPKLVGDLEKYFPGSAAKIKEIEICRYGHHFAVPYPGFITGVRRVVKKPYHRYFFAKDDTQGIPCLESAIWSGINAANETRQKIR